MTLIFALIIITLAWFGIGWAIIVTQGLITSNMGRRIIDKISNLADSSEHISPFLALIIFFGPIGILLKKSLYGTDTDV